MVCHKFNASIDTLSQIKPLVSEKYVFEYREKFIIEALLEFAEYQDSDAKIKVAVFHSTHSLQL